MKKLLCTILALVMILMCSCNGKTKDLDADKEKDTEKKEEVTTAPETEKPAPPTFFEENGLVLNTNASMNFSSAYTGIKTSGPSLSKFGTSMGANRFTDDYSNGQTVVYKENYNVLKYYGNGQEITTPEVDVNINVSETKLFGKDDFINLAMLYKTVEGYEKHMNRSDLDDAEVVNDVKTLASELEEKYAGYKIVNGIIDFQWGKIDNMALMQELGSIHGIIGFELFDKYTGTVLTPGESGKLEDQTLEVNGEKLNITILSTGGGWVGTNAYDKDILNSVTSITAIVPVDYDGAVFMVGDGDMKDLEKPEGVYNLKDSYLYGKESTDYFAPVARKNAQAEELVKYFYSQKMPEKDANISTTFEDIYSLEFAGVVGENYEYDSTLTMKADCNGTGEVYLVNDTEYTVSLFAISSFESGEVIAQSGSIASGEALYGSTFIDYSNKETSPYYGYGIVYYNTDGSIAYISVLQTYTEVF